MSEKLVSTKDRGIKPLVSKNILRVIPAPVILAALLGCSVPGPGYSNVDGYFHMNLSGQVGVGVSTGVVVTDLGGHDHVIGITAMDGKVNFWSSKNP